MAFGLDISDRKLRMAVLKRKRGKVCVTSASEIDLEPGLIEDGEILSKEKVSGYIQELLQKARPKKLDTREVVACLPERKSFIKVISLPKNKDNTKKEVFSEIKKHFPYQASEVYIDWQEVQLGSQDYQCLLAGASPRTIVDTYIETLTQAQLIPTILEIESVAIARGLLPDASSISDPLLIIDIGRDRSTFIVFKQGLIYFTSSTKKFSGNLLTQNIKKELSISEKEAEILKQKVGYNSQSWNGKIEKALSPPLNQLLSAIKEIFVFFQGHYQDSRPVGKIILTGGGSKTPQLTDVLSSNLKIDCVPLFPKIKVLGAASKVINDQNIHSFTTAIGLALRGIQKNDHS